MKLDIGSKCSYSLAKLLKAEPPVSWKARESVQVSKLGPLATGTSWDGPSILPSSDIYLQFYTLLNEIKLKLVPSDCNQNLDMSEIVIWRNNLLSGQLFNNYKSSNESVNF